ncbi:MAG: Trm112 family protein [Candidatus Omnitrophota bacterium]
MINPELLKIMACPACKQEVELIKINNEEKIRCKGCNRKYPIRNDIPIMLIEEAVI